MEGNRSKQKTLKKRLRFLIACCFFPVWGCAGSGPVGTAEESVPSLSNYFQFSKIQTIEIQDNWMGLSELGPLGKRYLLRPDGEQFSGQAIFSVGGGPRLKTREVVISIPKEISQQFLGLLSEVSLEKGTYRPSITHTDDYPSRKVDISRLDGKLSFYSESQGETAVPWGATFRGENYTVKSDRIAVALAKIGPYLREEDFQKFMEEMRSSSRKR